MIKCDEKAIEIEGRGIDLMVEFASIAKHLVKGGCPKKILDVAYESAFKTEAELKAKNEKLKSEFLNDVAPKIINDLSEMIKRCQEEDNNED